LGATIQPQNIRFFEAWRLTRIALAAPAWAGVERGLAIASSHTSR
jgi:hypothetical protein